MTITNVTILITIMYRYCSVYQWSAIIVSIIIIIVVYCYFDKLYVILTAK